MELLKSAFPANSHSIMMHDWWLYVVVSTFGEVFFDPNAYIRYRQHSGNAIGGESRGWRKWAKRFRRFSTGRYVGARSRQAMEFLNCYGDQLQEQLRTDIEQFIAAQNASLWSRCGYLLRMPFYWQHWTDRCIFSFIYVAGKL